MLKLLAVCPLLATYGVAEALRIIPAAEDASRVQRSNVSGNWMAAIDARNWLLVEPTVTAAIRCRWVRGRMRTARCSSLRVEHGVGQREGCVMSCPGQVSAGALGSSAVSSRVFRTVDDEFVVLEDAVVDF